MQLSPVITDDLSELTRNGISDSVTRCFVGAHHIQFKEPFYTKRNALTLGDDVEALAAYSRRYLKIVTALALHRSLYMTVNSAVSAVAQLLHESHSARQSLRSDARSLGISQHEAFVGLVRNVTTRAISDVFYGQNDAVFHHAYATTGCLLLNVEQTIAFVTDAVRDAMARQRRAARVEWKIVVDEFPFYAPATIRLDLTVSCGSPHYYQ